MTRLRLILLVLMAASLACNTLLPGSAPSPTPVRDATIADATHTPEPSRTPRPTFTPLPATSPAPDLTATAGGPTEPVETPLPPPAGVRACAFDPLTSVPAAMPANLTVSLTATAVAPVVLPPNTAVDAATTETQLRVFDELVETIETQYIYPDFNGVDWPAVVAKYRALVEGGLTGEDFAEAVNLMLIELGDEHSYYESPEAAAESDAAFAGNNDYVGIGVLVQSVPDANRGVIILTFPGGPADEAGLLAHDAILAVDGQPLLDETGAVRDVIRGPEGSQVTLTLQRPGEAPYDVTLTRRRITGRLPIDYCMVPRTRVGYLFLPGLDDETIPGQVREALQALAAEGPLDGLILDNRQNGGGASTVLEEVLALFTGGTLGQFVSRDDSRPLEVEPEDVAGSQDVPLVVLVEVDTVSYGEVLSGVLQTSGRAVLIGQTTLGNVETLWGYPFEDGSRAWIAREAFQPVGQDIGVWEDTGIVPDIHVPTRWDLFTEANDPALAAAVAQFYPVANFTPPAP